VINYIGNQSFRSLVRLRKEEYANCVRHKDKNHLARQIIDEIERRGGRFLRRIDDPQEARTLGVPQGVKAWKLAEFSTAMEKCKQALRDREPTGATSLSSSSFASAAVSVPAVAAPGESMPTGVSEFSLTAIPSAFGGTMNLLDYVLPNLSPATMLALVQHGQNRLAAQQQQMQQRSFHVQQQQPQQLPYQPQYQPLQQVSDTSSLDLSLHNFLELQRLQQQASTPASHLQPTLQRQILQQQQSSSNISSTSANMLDPSIFSSVLQHNSDSPPSSAGTPHWSTMPQNLSATTRRDDGREQIGSSFHEGASGANTAAAAAAAAPPPSTIAASGGGGMGNASADSILFSLLIQQQRQAEQQMLPNMPMAAKAPLLSESLAPHGRLMQRSSSNDSSKGGSENKKRATDESLLSGEEEKQENLDDRRNSCSSSSSSSSSSPPPPPPYDEKPAARHSKRVKPNNEVFE